MLSDFKMIAHDFPTCEGIKIYPISDVHLGAKECMWKEFAAFIDAIAEDENAYLVLGGDLLDCGIKKPANPFDQTMRPMEAKLLMAETLDKVKDKILAATGGNHEARMMSIGADSDPTYDIMVMLGKQELYRPNACFMAIRFGGDNKRNLNGKSRPSYSVALMHGAGGGSFTGSAVNRNERFGGILDVDALIVGHSHKPAVTNPSRLRIDMRNLKVNVVPYKQIISTAWLDYGGYALNKQLLPAGHQMQTLFLNGTKKEMLVTM